jgi:peptide/nickel transport system substrate-binding protein
LQANPDYYLGRPAIDRIVVNAYPSVRLAWAEMLRNRSDMVYDVGIDALDSLTSSKNVSVFTYTRHYQYALALNTRSGDLRSADIRRALNLAIDRNQLVKDAFYGHAMPSTGLLWPQHWANDSGLPHYSFDPEQAARVIRSRPSPVRFTCLVLPGFERVALVVKRQLEGVGVEMSLEEQSFDHISKAVGSGNFDAVLMDWLSGPSLFRPYLIWHSGGLLNPGGLGSADIDAAFDRVRYATTVDGYRGAVRDLAQAVIETPPAIFLAWGERARAVSRRFDVAAEPGRDVLTTLRLWQPVNALEYASRN